MENRTFVRQVFSPVRISSQLAGNSLWDFTQLLYQAFWSAGVP